MGIWVAVDPAGFQDIVAARAVLSAGAWLLLAVGIALSLLGFLGCCGALRRSRPLLLLVREGRWVGRGCRIWAEGTGGRSCVLEGGEGCRCSWRSQERVFLILNMSCPPLPSS